jgi:hypothetical protein
MVWMQLTTWHTTSIPSAKANALRQKKTAIEKKGDQILLSFNDRTPPIARDLSFFDLD